MKTDSENLEMDVRRLTLGPGDILAINIEGLDRLPRSKAQEYMRTLRINIEEKFGIPVLITAGNTTLTVIEKTE
jgi:hypothetical protein